MSTYPHRDEPHYVYRCYDAAGDLLYVGCTYNPVARREQHEKRSPWFADVATTRLTVFPTRKYGLAKEAEAILAERPKVNRPPRRQLSSVRASLTLIRGGAA